MTKHNIANLERVAAAATDGPWYHDQNGDFVAKGSVENIEGLICDLRGFGAGFDLDRNGRHIATFNPDTAQAFCKAIREARAALERINQFPTGVKISYDPAVPQGFTLFDIQDDQRKALANLDAQFDFTEENKP